MSMMTKEQAQQVLNDIKENPKSHSIDKIKEAIKIVSTIVKPS
jgi:hypothetical protein